MSLRERKAVRRSRPARNPRPIDAPLGWARYERMFPDLPRLEDNEEFLHTLGDAGGLCDCEDPTDPPESLGAEAAGWPIFGQFVGHDITADRSALQSHVDPHTLRNARLPRFDLEALYADGPVGNPFLYHRSDPAKLLLGTDEHDVPRNQEGIAIIGDPRNDSHLLLAQMHRALLAAHNAFVDDAREAHVPEHEVFAWATREIRWHYQWAILHEFLPVTAGKSVVDSILAEGPMWFRPGEDLFIPLEFADAAYRYGHCQIRQQYQLNAHTRGVPLFPDLLGFRPIPADKQIDWSFFFDAGSQRTAQRAKKIDGKLPGSLMHLPAAITGNTDPASFHSLAARDLQRGHGVGLPSGEAISRHVGERPLSREEVGLDRIGWPGETPLWYYLLREADVRGNGDRLGPIGGRIVAEVLITLLQHDPHSICSAEPAWRPRRSLIELLS